MKKSLCITVCTAMILVLCGMSNVYAGDTEVHGYGFQGYLKSTKNNYLDAIEGTYAFTEVAVLFSNKVADNTTVWIQIFGNSDKFGLDWAFVDYQLSNELSIKAGQSKFPIGLINEIRDNKILHLAMAEPIMYREESDIIFEAYRGAGIAYSGPVSVDLFGGAPVIESENPLVKDEVKKLAGGRITYQTPLEGLKLMGSYAEFREELISNDPNVPSIPEGAERLELASASYEHGGLELNAEYGKKKNIEADYTSYYVEAGYHFFDKLTPFVRYDYILNTTEGADRDAPESYQKETVLGVGYKFNSSFAVKVEEHWIEGYALSVATGETAAGAGEKKWDMFAAGINFMF